jgi:hypothetical protein
MAKKSELFTSEKEDLTTITFKAPLSLKQRAERISEKIGALKPGVKFSLNKLLLREMEEAITLAEEEVKILERGQSQNPKDVDK